MSGTFRALFCLSFQTIGSDLCRNRRFSQSFLCLIPKLNLKKVWKSKVESKPIEDLNAMQSQIMSHMFDNNHEIRFEENQHFNDETSEMIAQSRPTLDDSHYPRQQTSPVTINDFYDISNDFSPLDHKENVDGFEALIEIPMKDRPKTPSAANVLQFREVSGTLKGFQGSDEAGINVKSGDGREVNESKRTIADANAFRDNLGGVIQVVNTFSSHRSVNKVKNVDFLPKVATFSTTPWKPMPPINFQYLHQTNDFTKRPRFPVIHKTTKIPFFTTTSTQSNQRIKDLEAKEQNIRAEKLMKLTENKRIVNRPTIETIRDWSLKMSKSRKNWLPSTDEVIVGSNRLFNTSNTNITNGFKDSITKSIPDYDLDKEKVSFKAIEATKTEKSQVSDVTLATHLGAVNNRESSISKEKPGPEYPTYSSAASSTFRCESLGFFADTSFECQVK